MRTLQGDRGAVARAQGLESWRGCQDGYGAVGACARRLVAVGRERQGGVLPDQRGDFFQQYESAIGQVVRFGLVAPLPKNAGDGAGGVQAGVKLGDLAGMSGCGKEIHVVSAATFAARTVTGGKRDGLVVEKQFRVAVWGSSGCGGGS